MAAPSNHYAFDLEIALDAAKRWHAEARARDQKIRARDEGRLDQAETKVRIKKRVRYLLDKV